MSLGIEPSGAGPELASSSLRTRAAIDPVGLYASAIDTSNYVERLAPLIRRHASPIGDLLDVGAGGGQLGRALREPDRRWTAIEPSPTMRARLARFDDGPHLVAAGWETADVAPQAHDTVLAATLGAWFEDANGFLTRCRAWARRTVVWVVPAHHGARGLVYAGCLPAAWHGEDETPGIDLVLPKLAARPDTIAFVDWTFSGVVEDIDTLAIYLADRLGWSRSDGSRRRMGDHLAAQAKADPAGYRLDIPRRSAILVWGRRPWVGNSVASG